MTKKEGLIEFYKENHKEGALFCVIYKKVYDSMEKIQLKFQYLKI